MDQPQQTQQMQIKASDDDLKGRYANAMQVSHTKEEFTLDFFLLQQPFGQLVSRIIVSPGHLKRVLTAFRENLKRYENQFGEVEEAREPERQEIGFKTEEPSP